jgi:hypothetical protein
MRRLPVGCVNPSVVRSAPELSRSRRVGLFGLGWREAASWSCRCCTCCSGVSLRWRRCGCARASSRSSRSWCCATNWLCFGARSLVRGWMSVTASSLLRPASYLAEQAGRSSSDRTPCWVGIASLCGDGGRMRDGDPPITDRALHHVAAEGWTFDDLARALLPDDGIARQQAGSDEPEDVVVALAVQSLAVRDMRNVPVERVVELRENHGADFRRFRRRVEELAAGVSDLGDIRDPEALAHHVEVRYQETVAEDLQALREALRQQTRSRGRSWSNGTTPTRTPRTMRRTI